jgi:ribonuclease HII
VEPLEARARAEGFRAVAGVDEAGRGPLAGPVVAAAVILPEGFSAPGIRDSKALSLVQRERAFSLISSEAVAWGTGSASVDEIDRSNILSATLVAMRRAVESLPVRPDFVFVDGTFTVPALFLPQEALVKGDGRCLSVAAASIVAKVTRDREMEILDLLHPGYGFAAHKGYGTGEHLAALRRLGPSPVHRRTFRGVLA